MTDEQIIRTVRVTIVGRAIHAFYPGGPGEGSGKSASGTALVRLSGMGRCNAFGVRRRLRRTHVLPASHDRVERADNFRRTATARSPVTSA